MTRTAIDPRATPPLESTCDVRGPTILNICALAERGPVVLGFLATRGGDCADSFDVLAGVERRHPGVQVAVIGIRGELGALRAIVRRRGWEFPVGWDPGGVLANLYGVAVCPHSPTRAGRGGCTARAGEPSRGSSSTAG